MNIINDKTIDIHTARYWCIFADKKFSEFIKTLTQSKDTNESILGLLGYSGYIFSSLALARLVSPFFKNMWRKCFRSKDYRLAEVTFDADGTHYTAYFNLNAMKWKLFSNFHITPSETVQFFETNFFKTFNTQCIKYIQPILASKDSILKQLKKHKNKIDTKYYKFLIELLNNDKQLIANMFDPHYET